MESQSKTFSRKLIALFLSVVLALSCFTGALTAYAKSSDDYNDANLASNFMAWAETTDEQTAEALLDYADLYVGDLMTGLLGSDHLYFSQNVVIATITIDAYFDSVDGLLDAVRQIDGIVNSYGSLVGGDVKNIDLSPLADLSSVTSGSEVFSKCGRSYRSQNDAKDIIMALAKTLYINSNDFAGKNVIGQFVKGDMDLGLLESFIGGDIYTLLKDTLGMWDGYQSNLVYNIVANLIWENTNWYTDQEIADFKVNLGTTSGTWEFDTELFGKMTTELLDKISVLVTYPEMVTVPKKDANGDIVVDENGETVMTQMNDSSANRRANIDAYMEENGVDYETAAKALGYDPNLVYSTEEGFENNVLLFQYGDKKLTVTKDDTLFDVAFKALELAWDTVLKGTLGLVHVNYDVDRGHGANFDNVFYYWMSDNKSWNTDDWKSNYSAENVEAWAEAEYEGYGCADAAEFLANVRHTYEYDRTIVDNPKNNWQDIDSTTLFNKLRYNPLADLYFNMQTGPINLYLSQTGISNIESFFETAFTSYDNMVAAFNDCLVAVTKDLFPNSSNIGLGDGNSTVTTNLEVPTMATTGNTTDVNTITTTLVSNICAMVEYVGNTADENIFGGFYANNSITSKSGNISEANAEEAFVPLLISCLQNIVMTEPIHDEKWDACKDAEGVAIVALEEYLSYVLPDKDYSVLWSTDSNGYIVAGNIDISGDGAYTLFEDAVMPMCRDALGYIISSIVPCRTAAGDEWNVYKTSVTTDTTTIFEILNSVVCYYASTDNFSDGTAGKAVASLLGIVTSDGTCQISMNNDLWTNIDYVANRLFPVIGTLQYGSEEYKGQASSYDLIYNKIIKGFLDIGENNGITNFIKQFLTICTSDPIANKGIDVMVYDDVVAPLVNGLFGARYTGQGYTYVMPYSSYYDSDSSSYTKSSAPFDSLVHADTIAHYSQANGSDDGYDTGILGVLICNVYEAFGGSSYGTSAKAGADGCWVGAMFAVEAVNNFIPSFVPQLADHTLNMASAKITDASQSGLTSGQPFTSTKLNITNNARGLNRFYRDANGVVQQDNRYFINVTSVVITDENGNTPTNITMGTCTGVVAPDETMRVNISGTAPDAAQLYTFTITYDIFEAKMNGTSLPDAPASPKYSDVQTRAYLYLTSEKDWKNTLYTSTSNGCKAFDSAYIQNYGESCEYTTTTDRFGKSDYLVATLPNDFIVPISNPSSIDELGIRTKNRSGTTIGSSVIGGGNYSIDGIYTYMTSGTVYQPVSGTTVSDETTASADDQSFAYVSIDKSNGDILNNELYDYRTSATDWDRGTLCSDTTTYDGNTFNTKNMRQGYTAEEINNLDSSIKDAEGFETRPHVAFTIDEAMDAGLVKGVIRDEAAPDEDGNKTYIYEAVFMAPTTLFMAGGTVNSAHTSISYGTPTPGIFLSMDKVTLSAQTDNFQRWISYDGSTALSADDYEMKVCLYNSNESALGKIHMYIADDTGAQTLTNAYNSDLKSMSAYQASDFKAMEDGTDVYTSLQEAFSSALAVVSTPLNTTTSSKLGNTYITEAKTSATTSTTGDLAYKPCNADTLPGKIMAYATRRADGYWFWNEEMTMPIYTAELLTDSDVTGGQDAAGQAVTKGTDGKWYLANDPLYETEWDTTSYDAPYLTETSTQATNAKGELLYEQKQFVYRDVNGDKTTSTAMNGSEQVWVYKLAESSTVIKPNDGNEYRGLYQQAIDRLDYWMSIARSSVNTEIAADINTNVSEARADLNNVNYNVATYEKMVSVAKDAESLIWSETVLDENGDKVLDEDGNPTVEYKTSASSIQVQEAINVFQRYKAIADEQARGYVGDKLEAEIVCASNYAYSALGQSSVTETVEVPAVVDETTGEEITPATTKEVTTYTVTGTANQPAEYGAYNADGVLVNEGETVYTAESWTNYVNALGAAIEVAQKGNADASNDDAKVTNCYSAKTDLQIAENNLTEDTGSDNITVSGTVMIATDPTGTEYTSGLVGINITTEDGTVVATTAADGTFTAEVPVGTTTLILTGDTTIDRTVTLTGTADVTGAVIPIVMCDYNKDGSVNGTDAAAFSGYLKEYYVYADFNVDSSVNGTDAAPFAGIVNKTINYGAIALD
ncbi:MAG: dockerin type I domain-containing protein [Eubacterium sp.]